MAINFLYLEDEPEVTARGLITNLDDKENLDFTVLRPKTWNQQRKFLIEDGELNNYDGLLLDLKLEFSDDDNNEIKYTGADLAQSIRNDAKSDSIKDLPIFLCSTNDYYMAYFDRTSVDLFDKKYKKEATLNTGQTKKELISFVLAYQQIHSDKRTAALIGKDIQSNVDIGILDIELSNFQTPHELVYLVNRYFVHTTGLLVDEDLLAIRLGININKSPDWENFKNSILKDFKYNGILSECYERWWQYEVNQWWKKTFEKSLIVTGAEERVSRIKEKFGFDIECLAVPDNQNYSTYWYKCKLSNIPLDPTEGLRTIEMPRYAWQEPSYISISYLLSDERDLKKISALLGPNEREIFEELDKK